MPRRLPNAAVLDGITRTLLSPPARRAIIAGAKRGCGAARDLPGILALAKKHGANARTCAAAFGFLPDAHRPRKYVDVLADDDRLVALLPNDPEVSAAFALSRAIYDQCGAFFVE